MATYRVTHKQRVDGFACLETLVNFELSVGKTITVASVDATFNGSHVVLALPAFAFVGVSSEGDLVLDYNERRLNQIVFANAGDDLAREYTSTGTVAYSPTVTWIADADVLAWLGITVATAGDAAFITVCTTAANQFCYRRRREAGYFDLSNTAPSGDVKLGTIMYAGALYRARGSLGDTFSQFDGMGNAPIIAMPAMVRQLLGVDRPQIA